MEQLQLGNITVDVVQKDIKNVHLSVYPPTGRVRISAPFRMNLDTIRIFAISKLNWIKKQQTKLRNQEREAPREFLNRESHYFNGKRYLLEVIEQDAAPKVELKHSKIELYVRPQTNREKMKSILDEWYRSQLKASLPTLIEKWEKKMNVRVNEFGIKKMKTRWGTCNRKAKRIWLNLELAKKPGECLEYIVVHEMVHLLERNHNDRFTSLMNAFMPKWRFYKDELNRLSVRHEDWNY
ncbi:MAG: SprT family zinc-dependent metalloprotease [Deltaproteobacteria bacterium]|nr:SprT family zinc-dependent metalloprotease [Deltaproteobacteria bacterium]